MPYDVYNGRSVDSSTQSQSTSQTADDASEVFRIEGRRERKKR